MSTGNFNLPNPGTTTQTTSNTTTTIPDNDDPEKLLNEWLGELKTIIGDLDTKAAAVSTGAPVAGGQSTESPSKTAGVQSRNRKNHRTSEFNRFSMANLEDTHETELDAILGELSMLEMDKPLVNAANTTTTGNQPIRGITSPMGMADAAHPQPMMHHNRSNSIVSQGATSIVSSLDGTSTASSMGVGGYAESTTSSSGLGSSAPSHGSREPRTDSPDNDSAFSDTVSLLSTDTSSTSSGLTNGQFNKSLPGGNNSHLCRGLNLQEFDNQKAAKIHLALQKLEQASVRRLFVKAFTADGASKSLLVDESMTSGHVTKLLADKNHVHMDPRWALVEQLPEIQMERLYEDHELLVDKLMMWDRDSKNRILFVERPEKVVLFYRPELFLTESASSVAPKDMDECNRNYILDDFFNSPNAQMPMEGGLYLRTDSKKGWKRHHFVLRGSGLYYYPKDKTRNPRDLVCLGLFNDCEVYKGFGWRKKYKAPTDFTFTLHAAHELANSKTTKPLKVLCADDGETLERWVLAIRVAKYGKQLWQSFRALREDLARDDFDEMATRRSSSINSFAGTHLDVSANGRPLSRASSSSSSGCLSDENNGFDSEFTTGTIKRKPSMKPNIPLTSMTRQLKEVGETRSPVGSPERGGTLTRNRVGSNASSVVMTSNGGSHLRQRSIDSSGSGGSGCSTLKRRPVASAGVNGSGDFENTPTVTSPLKSMPSCMTDSVFSLPPPPEEILAVPVDMGSTMSLDSLPPPPSVNELEESLLESSFSSELGSAVTDEIYSSAGSIRMTAMPLNGLAANVPNLVQQPPPPPQLKATTPIYAQPKKELGSCLKKESIYATKSELRTGVTASPVTLRKKVCFEDQVMAAQSAASPTKRLTTSSNGSNSIYGSLPPKPPPRSEGTRLSTQPVNASGAGSNNEFLKDLQRVMRKKWQVAQKCKAEPETNPHEVLGFRDFEEWQKQNNQVPFYRQSSNVSNWVQEHYGPDSLYENLGGVQTGAATGVEVAPPQVNYNGQVVPPVVSVPAAKKRPPPLPPKRSETTQLSHGHQSPVHQVQTQVVSNGHGQST